jgi:hypothetical protein
LIVVLALTFWPYYGIVNAEYIVTELVVEENTISSAEENNRGGGSRPSGSTTALCKMEKGDHAWIRTTGVFRKA